MALPGITDELELKRLLRKLLDDPGLSYSFAVVARGLKDGDLSLSKKQKLKRKEVVAAAEEMAREEMEREDAARGDFKQRGKKPPKSDILVGTCRLLKPDSTKLFLQVQGKVIPKAVACLEFLLIKGPFKTLGITGVDFEEIDEDDDEGEEVQDLGSSQRDNARTSDSPVNESVASDVPPTSQTDRGQSEATARLAAEFKTRLKQLLPALDKARGTPAGEQARRSAVSAGDLAKQLRFADALERLGDAESVLRETEGRSTTARTSSGDAIDRVQQQLEKLAAALLDSKDANMIWVAEEGLSQILGGLRDSAGSLDRLSNKLPLQVARFAKPVLAELEKRLDAPPVKACDQNQFGVAVSIRRTIESALSELVNVLEASDDVAR